MARLLPARDEIHVKAVTDGSVVLTIELSAEDAAKLVVARERGGLDDLKIADVKFLLYTHPVVVSGFGPAIGEESASPGPWIGQYQRVRVLEPLEGWPADISQQERANLKFQRRQWLINELKTLRAADAERLLPSDADETP